MNNYENIETFYRINKELLIDGDYRPVVSYNKDAEEYINKLVKIYEDNNCPAYLTVSQIEKGLKVSRGSNVATTECPLTWLSLGLVEETDNKNKKDPNYRYKLTSDFCLLAKNKMIPGVHILNRLYSIKSLTTISKFTNLLLCTLREGYIEGRIIDFPRDNAEYLKRVKDSKKREEFSRRVNRIYGYGLETNISPHASMRAINNLVKLELIEQCEENEFGFPQYKITNYGHHLLEVLNSNFEGLPGNGDNTRRNLTTNKTNVEHLNVYRPFITAIKSKPFLLLAGISGTGKSRIVRELARACWDEGSEEYKAQKPRNFEMVQVKPNWHDSSELIGYVSRVSGTPVFVAGDFLKFVAKAWEEPEVPYFLCLDEMNLAPVEQYFAEYLSVVESRKAKEGGKIETDPIIKEDQQWYWDLCRQITSDEGLREHFRDYGVSIPQNLIVVGTVNMDETTFSFSRKVLDRAMTIEMNEVDLLGGLDSRHEKIGKLGSAELIGNAVEGVDVYSAHKGVCDTAIAYLQKINDKLEGTPFKIAYRTRNEVLLYVVNNLPYNKEDDGSESLQEFVIARALDEITNMKILSRIEGDETRVSMNFLEGLENTIKEGLDTIFDGPFGKEETDEAYKSVSLAKLDEMKKRLSSGYTSFWS